MMLCLRHYPPAKRIGRADRRNSSAVLDMESSLKLLRNCWHMASFSSNAAAVEKMYPPWFQPRVLHVTAFDNQKISCRQQIIRQARHTSSVESLSSTSKRDHYLVDLYSNMVKLQHVQNDVHQLTALSELDRLRTDLLQLQSTQAPGPSSISHKRTDTNESIQFRDEDLAMGSGEEDEKGKKPMHVGAALAKKRAAHTAAQSKGFWGSFFGSLQKKSEEAAKTASKAILKTRHPASAAKGVYLHGGVGCGKTFCMDLFYHSILGTRSSFHTPTENKAAPAREEGLLTGGGISSWISNPIHMTKQKVHFHKFMLESVHRQMHTIKQSHPSWDADEVMAEVVTNILHRGQILCFDEFQVTDVADALILRRLFTGLMEAGAVLVITSNRPPEDLYIGGIQRDLFLPFIDLLSTELKVISMWDSETDYRLVAAKHKARGVYFVGPNSKPRFHAAFTDLTKRGIITRDTHILTADKRKVPIPCASIQYKVAKFSFEDLCKKATGAADYLAIGEHFHTIFLYDVPKLSMHEVNLVRRMITFVDAMYECHVKVIIHAEAKPSELFQVDLENKATDEAFAFDRTRSRLDEMRSESYLKKKWVGENKKRNQKLQQLSEKLS
jgi:protein AFG1